MTEPTVSFRVPLSDLTPEQLAEAFWALDSDRQARFFGHLGACALATPGPFDRKPGSWFGFDWQMYHAGLYPATPLAAEVMRRIGENADRAMSDRLRLECARIAAQTEALTT